MSDQTNEDTTGGASPLDVIVSRLNTSSTNKRIRLLDELKHQGKLDCCNYCHITCYKRFCGE
jgi:hypothetical protein